MGTRAFVISVIGAVAVSVGLIIGLTSMSAPDITSRNGPSCAVRTSEVAVPTNKAEPFGGSGSMTMSTPAPPSPVCGS
jgi:hypothetical protein